MVLGFFPNNDLPIRMAGFHGKTHYPPATPSKLLPSFDVVPEVTNDFQGSKVKLSNNSQTACRQQTSPLLAA
jgi:hypothetical protein